MAHYGGTDYTDEVANEAGVELANDSVDELANEAGDEVADDDVDEVVANEAGDEVADDDVDEVVANEDLENLAPNREIHASRVSTTKKHKVSKTDGGMAMKGEAARTCRFCRVPPYTSVTGCSFLKSVCRGDWIPDTEIIHRIGQFRWSHAEEPGKATRDEWERLGG